MPTINLNITRKEFDMIDKSATLSLRCCKVIKSTCNHDLKMFIGYNMTGALFPYFSTLRRPPTDYVFSLQMRNFMVGDSP
jgi:hypothetical protein